ASEIVISPPATNTKDAGPRGTTDTTSSAWTRDHADTTNTTGAVETVNEAAVPEAEPCKPSAPRADAPKTDASKASTPKAVAPKFDTSTRGPFTTDAFKAGMPIANTSEAETSAAGPSKARAPDAVASKPDAPTASNLADDASEASNPKAGNANVASATQTVDVLNTAASSAKASAVKREGTVDRGSTATRHDQITDISSDAGVNPASSIDPVVANLIRWFGQGQAR
ncbi:MAG: hypothetical protein Q9225_005030, partial [Loekoesia sp. 1 TL-2023]